LQLLLSHAIWVYLGVSETDERRRPPGYGRCEAGDHPPICYSTALI